MARSSSGKKASRLPVSPTTSRKPARSRPIQRCRKRQMRRVMIGE
jgi:hypothetical protein